MWCLVDGSCAFFSSALAFSICLHHALHSRPSSSKLDFPTRSAFRSGEDVVKRILAPELGIAAVACREMGVVQHLPGANLPGHALALREL